LYIQGSTLTLDNSQVVTNTAGTVGGGIRLFGNSKLLIRNDSELRNNHATHGEGGAVAAADTPDITIAESVLQDNSAGTHGGAIYLAGGSLIFQDWWALHSNAAGGNGGALAITGTGNAWFAATTAGSSILDNQANGNGGAIYLNNNSACELYSTAGYLFSLGGNQAGGHGGAGYADNGGHFDVWGRLVVTANRAPAGSGGAFYLSNGSRLWLDDASAGKIEMRENWAQNGGAIYAQDSPNIECDGASFGYTPEGNLATAGSGGAIYVDNSSFSADNCVFNNNRATLHGGAIAAYDSTLTIFASYTSSAHTVEGEPGTELLNPQRTLAAPCDPLTTQCSSINGNQADSNHDASGSGGAIYSSNSGVNVSYTYMRYNRAATGGAVYQEGASASAHVSNTLIYNNTVTSASGAGIFKNGGAFTVMHTTIANNSGGAGFSGTASEVHNSIAWGNDSAGFDAEPGTASCNIDQSGNAGAAVNPRFVAPGAGEDYHLFVGSPAVDVCITGLSPDLDNLLRPFGKAYDMGSFESRQRSIYLPVNMR
jgi:predicted outer membrane repeat protein